LGKQLFGTPVFNCFPIQLLWLFGTPVFKCFPIWL
jgi:hypothetical protein